MLMFWAFKLSFVVNILAFFWLGNFLGYSLKSLANFFLIIWSPWLVAKFTDAVKMWNHADVEKCDIQPNDIRQSDIN